jgi:hypothetical protein
MSSRTPPRLATWLLTHLGPTYRRESLVGDLLEEYQQDRSRGWYWQQTGAALLIGVSRWFLLRLPKLVLKAALWMLIELGILMGIITGGMALAESNGPHHHSPPTSHLEQKR